MTSSAAQKQLRRYKHTGSMLPDFVFTECYDSARKTLTISAKDFDSVAIAEIVINNDYGIVAHEDETRQCALPTASVIVEISGARFGARVVRQRLYGAHYGEQMTVRLSTL